MADTSAPGPNPIAAVGERIGEYEVTGVLKPRGRLDSYTARQASTGRAVNLLAARTAEVPERVAARFDATADKVARIAHPNVATLFAHGSDDAKQCRWWAFELVEGESLLERTKRVGPLPVKELAAVGTHLSNALTNIYGNGLLHLGIKPSTILLDNEGFAKLLCLGVMDLGTEVGIESGDAFDDSVRYASPEQATGSQNLDTRSDVYSLGATLYYLATGRAPFAGTPVAEVPEKQASGQIPWPSDVNQELPPQISRVIAKMMAKDPDERYKTPTELSLDFGIVSQGQEPVIAAQQPARSTVAPSNRPVKPATAAKRRDRDTAKTKVGPAANAKAHGRTTAKTRVSPPVQRQGRRTPAGGVPTEPRGGRLDIRWLAAGGGGLIALILGLVLILSGQETPPTPPTVATPAPLVPAAPVAVSIPSADEGGDAGDVTDDVAAATDAQAPSALADIEEYFERNPSQFRDVIGRLNALRKKTKDKALSDRIRARMDEIRASWDERSRPLLEGVKPKAEALAVKHNYDGAFATVGEVRPQLSPTVAREANRFTGDIAKRGRTHIGNVINAAWGLAKKGDAPGARTALEPLKQVKYAKELQRADKRIKSVVSLVEKIEAAARAAAAKKAKAQLDGILAQFDTLLADGAYDQALELARSSAARPEMAAIAGPLEGAAGLAGAMIARRKAMIEYVRPKVGDNLGVGTHNGLRKGIVKEVSADGITLVTRMMINGQVRGETKYVVAWNDIAGEDAKRFARAWEPRNVDEHLAVATMALAANDYAATEAAVALASGHVLAGRVTEKLEAIKMAQSNRDAGLAWQMIERRAKAKEFTLKAVQELEGLIASFEEHHGKSDFMKQYADRLAAIKRANRRLLLGAGYVEGAVAFETRRYKLYSYVMTWNRARAFCEGVGGHLVTIGSAEENALVAGLVKKRGVGAWLGFAMATKGKWVDGSPVTFKAWKVGNRTVWRGKPFACVAGDDQTWIQAGATELQSVLCEWEAPARFLKPAPAPSDEPYVVPQGHKRAVLYGERFDKDAPGFANGSRSDTDGGCLLIGPQKKPRWNNAYFANKNLPKPETASNRARVSFRYRIGGNVGNMTVTVALTPTGDGQKKRSSYRLSVPHSRGWATLDQPLPSFVKAWRHDAVDMRRPFEIHGIYFSAGTKPQKGECLVDDIVIYDVVNRK